MSTSYDRPLDACEERINDAWVQLEVFFEDVVKGALGLVCCHISVPLLVLKWRLFILQLAE